MDDPWGSPWTTAETDTDKEQKAPSSPAKSDLEPPPRAFLSVSSSPRIPAISSPSPWADEEDGFGDWAAADTTPSTQSGWGGGWASPNPNLASPRRDIDFSKASPIAWPGSVAIPKPASTSSIRQPSPDPWAAEFGAQTPSNDGPATPRAVVETYRAHDPTEDELGNANIIITSEWDDQPTIEAKEVGTLQDALPILSLPEEPSKAKEEPKESTAHDISARSSIESPIRGRKLRSASPSDDETDREDERQDSPITSIDEDSKARQQVDRKASGKVQELVDKFDGLARAASREPPTPSRERSKSSSDLERNNGSDNAGEFGDFEDVDEDVDEPPRPSTPDVSTTAPRSVEVSPVSSRHGVDQAKSPPSKIDLRRESLAKIGSVGFTVDLSKVEELLGKTTSKPHVRTSDADADIPDRIITDSFTEISERKTWYRISRLGSSRKHNAGDDENYRRIGWGSSTIRLDTIKTVRRWMEEDSIAGRANLGGGTSKTQRNMFGWDSSAEPVTLDVAFGKKKTHTRTSSLQATKPLQLPHLSSQPLTSTDEARKTSGSLYSLTQRPASLVMPATASFGWSTSSPTAQASPVMAKPLPKSPVIIEAPASQMPPPSRFISQPLVPEIPRLTSAQNPPIAPITAPVNKLPAPVLTNGPSSLTNPPQDDDDDDWGEMVSSPSDSKPANGFLDLAEAFSAPPPISKPAQTTATPALTGTAHAHPSDLAPVVSQTASSNEDPWGAVDFSIFEKPVPSKQAASVIPAVVTKPTLAPFHTVPTTTTQFAIPIAGTPSPLPISTMTPISASSKTGLVDPVLRTASASQFTPTTPLQIASPVVLPVSAETDLGLGDLETSQTQQDDAARRIIANLPDLSYMFR